MRGKNRERRNGWGERKYGRVANARVTTFYIEKLPLVYNETQLWKAFQRWGRIWEIYVAPRVNAWGHRYGFIRFLDVKNVSLLERQLDNIYFGNIKINANIPKYQRDRTSTERTKQRYAQDVTALPTLKHKPTGYRGNDSYAKVAAKRNDSIFPMWKKKSGQNDISLEKPWNGQKIQVSETTEAWLKESWVGKPQHVKAFDKLMTVRMMNPKEGVSLQYMGDDLVLISGVNVDDVNQGSMDAQANFWAQFREVQPWSPTILSGYRLAWLQCYGIPLNVWGEDIFSQLLGLTGSFVMADEETISFSRINFARVLIRTTEQLPIQRSSRVKINGIMVTVSMFEEVSAPMPSYCGCLWKSGSNRSSRESEHYLMGEYSSSECSDGVVGKANQQENDEDWGSEEVSRVGGQGLSSDFCPMVNSASLSSHATATPSCNLDLAMENVSRVSDSAQGEATLKALIIEENLKEQIGDLQHSNSDRGNHPTKLAASINLGLIQPTTSSNGTTAHFGRTDTNPNPKPDENAQIDRNDTLYTKDTTTERRNFLNLELRSNKVRNSLSNRWIVVKKSRGPSETTFLVHEAIIIYLQRIERKKKSQILRGPRKFKTHPQILHLFTFPSPSPTPNLYRKHRRNFTH
ncbi:hypothetical protein Fmac_030573 [Flemingia macrophylla]|uniref:RRM domain-containing protein n=1 Tax=Flemingia macrophylla TaxID=520843 RepID=A0ABD1KZJ9_9FABA